MRSTLIPDKVHQVGAFPFKSFVNQFWDDFKKHMQQAIGAGQLARFWNGIWLKERSLIGAARRVGMFFEDHNNVKEFTLWNDDWDLSQLVNLLTTDEFNLLSNSLPPISSCFLDKPYLALSSLGFFIMTSTYNMLKRASTLNGEANSGLWKLAWQ